MNWAVTVGFLMFFLLNPSTSRLLSPLGILSKAIFRAIPTLDSIVEATAKMKPYIVLS